MSINGLYQKDKLISTRFFIFSVIYLLDKRGEHLAMLISDIRRQNARALAEEAGSPAEFGRRTSMPDSQISHLIGENPVKNIGAIIARRIENAFGKPMGWMDTPHNDQEKHEPARRNEKNEVANIITAEEIIELITLYKDAPAADRKMIMEAARLHLRRKKMLSAADR